MKTRTAPFFIGLVISSMIAGLTACSSQWQAKVNLSPEQRQTVQDQIASLKEEIKNYVPAKPEDPLYPPIPLYVDLGRAYEDLGNYRLALKTYQTGAKLHARSQALDHNIAKLYDKVGVPSKAAPQYQYLFEEYNEPSYLYDLAWLYIRAQDRKAAEAAFNLWQRTVNKTDEQTQEAIKQLRENE